MFCFSNKLCPQFSIETDNNVSLSYRDSGLWWPVHYFMIQKFGYK